MLGKQLFLSDGHAVGLRGRTLLEVIGNPERTRYVAVGMANSIRRDEVWELVWDRPNHWRFTGMMRRDDLEQICGKEHLHGFGTFFALDAGLFVLVDLVPDGIEAFRLLKQKEFEQKRYRCGLAGRS